MEEIISERDQKFSYEDYQSILKEMAHNVKKYRDQSIKAAQRNAFWQNLIDYPIKLLLGTSLSGGGIEGLGNLDSDQKWVSYTRTALEFIALVLLTTKDFGKFEKKKQKYVQAHTLLSSFLNIIKQQLKIRKGFEGDREEIVKELTDAFENIKGTNAIIQEFGIQEDSSGSGKKYSPRRVSFVPEQRQSQESSGKSFDALKKSDRMLDARSTSSESTETNPDVELDEMERGSRRPTLVQYKSMRQGKCSTALINDMLDRIN